MRPTGATPRDCLREETKTAFRGRPQSVCRHSTAAGDITRASPFNRMPPKPALCHKAIKSLQTYQDYALKRTVTSLGGDQTSASLRRCRRETPLDRASSSGIVVSQPPSQEERLIFGRRWCNAWRAYRRHRWSIRRAAHEVQRTRWRQRHGHTRWRFCGSVYHAQTMSTDQEVVASAPIAALRPKNSSTCEALHGVLRIQWRSVSCTPLRRIP